MGIFDRFRKKTEKDVVTLSPEKAKEIYGLLWDVEIGEKNTEEARLYLSKLSEGELKSILKSLDKEFEATGFAWGGDVGPVIGHKTTWEREFPGVKKFVENVLKAREGKKSKIPLGSLLKDKTGTFPRLEKEESTSKPSFFIRLFGSKQSEDESKLAPELTPEELLSGEVQDKAALQKLGMERSLQDLFDKLTSQLAEFWGIPASLISQNLPKVKIANMREMNNLFHDIRTPGGFIPSLNAVYFANWLVGERHMTPLMYGAKEEELEKDSSNALLKSRLEPLSVTSLKPMVAEEACHFLEDFVKTKMHIKDDGYVSEFFGMISRLYIAEQIPQMSIKDREVFIKKAIEVSDKEGKMRQQLEILNNETPDNTKDYLKNKMEIQKLEEELAHLAYFPASAYYYDVRKMSKEQRFKLLTMDPSLVKSEIVKPLNDNLLKVKNQLLAEGLAKKILTQVPKTSGIEETVLVGGAVATGAVTNPYDESIKDHIKARIYGIPADQQSTKAYSPLEIKVSEVSNTEQGLKNVGDFFQRAASEIGKAAYGRVAEAVAAKLEKQEPAAETGDEYPEEPEEEYPQEDEYSQEQPIEEEYQETQEAQEEEQSEEAQEEQYGPESEQATSLPKISISIPKKVPKDVAKKLESMGVKLPKKMIKD